MEYSAVVLDLDGTLLNSQKQVSKRNLEAILNIHQQGLRIIFATARPPRAVKWFLPDELLHMGSFVYYNGAQVFCSYSGFELHESINALITAELIDYCISNDPEVELALEVRDEWFSLKEVDYTVQMNVRGNPIVKPIEIMKQYDATKILLSGYKKFEELKRKFASELNILLTDNGELIQIMSKKASKEAAVSKLCEVLGLSIDNVIVFGDDFNDIGLFKVCGWSVAMGNAIEELKNISSEVTDSNDHDGVAMILERFL